jgi:tetratricopeptide (TPR) repeat protein
LVIGAAVLIILTACAPPDEREFLAGQSRAESKDYRSALIHYENSIKFAPTSDWAIRASREASRISQYELKDFQKALVFHRHLVLYSLDSSERTKSQREIAYINFDNLQNYSKAIIEFYKLLQMTEKESDIATYKLSIARANYYLSNFPQSLSEINEIFRLKIPESIAFDVLILNGNILVAQKQYAKAVGVFSDLLKRFPEKSEKENVPLTLAVCYEENAQFREAVDILEKLKDTYKPAEYIELRIKRLKERIKNQPGAKGLHRK